MISEKRAKGFTLIELLVVIAIIGLLATIVSANLVTARAKARDAKRIADIRSIQLALETYYNDNMVYPLSIYGNGYLVPTYLSTVPIDPLAPSGTTCAAGTNATNGCYVYTPFSSSGTSHVCNATYPATSYHLGATLEQTSNSALTQDIDSNPPNGTANCTGSGSDFSGLSATSNTKGEPCTATAGTAQPGGTETCYDVTN